MAVCLHITEGVNTITFSIQDFGIGIPLADQATLGTRYFRGQNADKAGGAGLGLFLCRRIVALHQGQFQIESVPGSGTTVQVTLPYGSNNENS